MTLKILPPASTSPIKSIQRGTITIAAGSTSNTATITAVDTSKATCVFLGFTTSYSGTSMNRVFSRLELTDSTTVTATRNNSDPSDSVKVNYEVVEFN